MNSNAMRVILGAASLKAYVTAPRDFHVLGIVRFGMEFGLLATDPAGHYFRVNGSNVEALDAGEVRNAIEYAYGLAARLERPKPLMPARVVSPPVIFRKHRHVPESTMLNRSALRAGHA